MYTKVEIQSILKLEAEMYEEFPDTNFAVEIKDGNIMMHSRMRDRTDVSASASLDSFSKEDAMVKVKDNKRKPKKK